jgi:PAS domain S-box-containing protein
MLLDANKKALEMIGRTREEIPGLHQSDLHPEREKNHFRQLFQKRAADGSGTDEEIIVNREGREIPVIVSATILNLGGMPCMMEIIHDISDIKKVQDALRLANKKLNLLAEITRHDIRNKLTVLGGYLHLFKDHPPEPQYSMYLAKLEETIVTVSNNIEFTRLYQDLGVVAPAWQNAHMTFFSACTHIDMKRVRILSDLDRLEIYADPLLERVFFNLADNAVQYGNRITTIRLSAEESAGGLIIRVQDDGVGIPPGDKEKIFTKGYGKNTGLGLFLAREILSITGITIKENGEYQHGALFELHVPMGMFRRTRP